jgi:acyl-coenzyme A thioesterase PaaI-like protein
MHGGVVATLLDAAMTHCLFAQGVQAVTARLSIRFRHPVRVGTQADVRAWLTRSASPLYEMRAELRQDERVCAAADAKFYQPA